MPELLNRSGSLLLIKGIDVSQPAEYISAQAATNSENFYIDRALLKKRVGTVVKGTLIGGTVMHGRQFNREGTLYNIAIGTSTIKRYDIGSSDWVDITGTSMTGTADDLIDSAIPLLSGKRILCITNGVNNIRKWVGSSTTTDLGGSPPKAKFIQEYQTYLVLANITGGVDISQRVQWSDTADPEEWVTGNAGAVDLIEDGEDISGLSLFGSYLAIHKESSIYLGYLVSSSAIFKFERKNTGRGTIANQSIVNLPTGEQIFLASDGIAVFNGLSTTLLDSPINDEIRDSLNSENKHKAWGVLVKEFDEVWLGLPIGSQTTGDTIYRYNYVTRVIYKDTRTNINSAWRADQTESLGWDDLPGTWDENTDTWNAGAVVADFPKVHLGNLSGQIVTIETNVGSDNGTAIEAIWESKDFETEEKGRMGRWLEFHLWARGSKDLIVEYSIDEGITYSSLKTFTLTDSFPSDDAPMIGYFDTISSHTRYKLIHRDIGTVEVKQFLIGYLPREYRY